MTTFGVIAQIYIQKGMLYVELDQEWFSLGGHIAY